MHRIGLISLGTAFGVQSLRAFLPLLVYVLRDRFGLTSIHLGGIGLLVFGTGFLFPAVWRRVAPSPVVIAGLGLIAARAALQFWRGDPAGSLILAGAGVVMFVAFLAAVSVHRGRSDVILGTLLGLLLDTSIHARLGTRDLHWGGGLESGVAGLLLLTAAVFAWLSWQRADDAPGPSGPDPGGPDPSGPALGGPGLGLLAWGPFLLLHLEVFGNVARFSSRTGLPTAHSGTIVALGLALAVAATVALRRQAGPRLVALAGAALLAGIGYTTATGGAAWPWLWLGQVSGGVLLGAALRRPVTAPRVAAQGVALGGGLVLFLLLLFAHYAGYDLPVPGTRRTFWLIGAAILTGVALRAALRGSVGRAAPAVQPGPANPTRSASAEPNAEAAPKPATTTTHPRRLLLAFALLLAALPLTRPTPKPNLSPLNDSFRAVSFNLHNGFDERGGFALDQMMSDLRGSHAEVIALQEVSRGWVVNGSLDLYELAREALSMAGAPGASVATDWGNAVFACAPIVSARTVPLPPTTLPLPRAVTDAQFADARGEPLRVLATHYHHVEADEAVRQEHSRFLAAEFPDPGAWILLGDFNAQPKDPCLTRLAEAGWNDVVAGRAEASLSTFPADAPVRRIDTILFGSGLRLLRTEVAPAWGSDHRAVMADLERVAP